MFHIRQIDIHKFNRIQTKYFISCDTQPAGRARNSRNVQANERNSITFVVDFSMAMNPIHQRLTEKHTNRFFALLCVAYFLIENEDKRKDQIRHIRCMFSML